MISSDVLSRAIETYNEYRSPMASATLVRTTEEEFVVRFEGPFTRMCCDYDYFEDLVYELQEVGIDSSSVAVESVSYTEPETFVVEFDTTST
ncbi:MAG: hypothetical protein ABEJ58_07615 [Halodesulfurarchaeum sp.]